jgi:hypothetical protein
VVVGVSWKYDWFVAPFKRLCCWQCFFTCKNWWWISSFLDFYFYFYQCFQLF